jgi:hypothetical protein
VSTYGASQQYQRTAATWHRASKSVRADMRAELEEARMQAQHRVHKCEQSCTAQVYRTMRDVHLWSDVHGENARGAASWHYKRTDLKEHTSRDRAYEQTCSRVARREAYEHRCSRVAQGRNASTHARSRAALHLPTPQTSTTVTPIPPWQVPCSCTKSL